MAKKLVLTGNARNCSSCGELKPLENFHKLRNGAHGRMSACKSCRKMQKAKAWREGENLAHRDYYFKRTYGITLNQYNQMFSEQSGCCKICGRHQMTQKRKLSVDHCHATGKVRNLLCTKCNAGLGAFSDNPELLSRAIKYIEMHKEKL